MISPRPINTYGIPLQKQLEHHVAKKNTAGLLTNREVFSLSQPTRSPQKSIRSPQMSLGDGQKQNSLQKVEVL